MTRQDKRGFTLIEMAIVLVIIGLLIGLTMPVVSDFINREKRPRANRAWPTSGT